MRLFCEARCFRNWYLRFEIAKSKARWSDWHLEKQDEHIELRPWANLRRLGPGGVRRFAERTSGG